MISRKHRLTTLSLLMAGWCSLSVAHGAGPTLQISGIGNFECENWLKIKDQLSTSSYPTVNETRQWIAGFLSAYNYYNLRSGKGGVPIPDRDSIEAYVDRFCEQNPTRKVWLGVPGMVEQLAGSPAPSKATPKKGAKPAGKEAARGSDPVMPVIPTSPPPAEAVTLVHPDNTTARPPALYVLYAGKLVSRPDHFSEVVSAVSPCAQVVIMEETAAWSRIRPASGAVAFQPGWILRNQLTHYTGKCGPAGVVASVAPAAPSVAPGSMAEVSGPPVASGQMSRTLSRPPAESSPTSPAATGGRGIWYTAREAQLQDYPSSESLAVDIVPRCVRVEATEERGVWRRIRSTSVATPFREGWVHLAALLPDGAACAAGSSEADSLLGPNSGQAVGGGEASSPIRVQLPGRHGGGGVIWYTRHLVNVRSAPEVNAPRLGSVVPCTPVATQAEEGDWVRVLPVGNGADFKEGWIHKPLLSPEPGGECSVASGGGTAAVAAVPPGAAAVAKSGVWYASEDANVRSAPDQTSARLGGVARCGRVEVIAEQGDWLRIRSASGEGWVFRPLFDPTPGECAGASSGQVPSAVKLGNHGVVFAQDDLNVRSAPDLTASRLGGVMRCTPVEVLEEQGDWARARIAGGQEGWVYKPLLGQSPGGGCPQ